MAGARRRNLVALPKDADALTIARHAADSAVDADEVIEPGEPTGWLSTGNDLMDWSISNNFSTSNMIAEQGLPRGRITEILSGEGLGKDTIALQVCRGLLRLGGVGLYADQETAIDHAWMRLNGVPPDSVILRTYTHLEALQDAAERFIDSMRSSSLPSLFVWSTPAATYAKAISEKKSAEDVDPVAINARLNSIFLARMLAKIRNTNIVFLILNQVRDTLAATSKWGATPPMQGPGGRAIRYYASVRIELTKAETIKNAVQGLPPPGYFIRSHVVKNRVGPPYRKAEFPLFFTGGVDNGLALLRYMENVDGEIEGFARTGNGRILFAGQAYTRHDFRKAMATDAKLMHQFRELVRETYLQTCGGEE